MPIDPITISKPAQRLRDLLAAALLVCVGAALVYDNLDDPSGRVCAQPRATGRTLSSLQPLAALSQLDNQVVHAPAEPPLGRADAIVDLATSEGLTLVQGGW